MLQVCFTLLAECFATFDRSTCCTIGFMPVGVLYAKYTRSDRAALSRSRTRGTQSKTQAVKRCGEPHGRNQYNRQFYTWQRRGSPQTQNQPSIQDLGGESHERAESEKRARKGRTLQKIRIQGCHLVLPIIPVPLVGSAEGPSIHPAGPCTKHATCRYGYSSPEAVGANGRAFLLSDRSCQNAKTRSPQRSWEGQRWFTRAQRSPHTVKAWVSVCLWTTFRSYHGGHCRHNTGLVPRSTDTAGNDRDTRPQRDVRKLRSCDSASSLAVTRTGGVPDRYLCQLICLSSAGRFTFHRVVSRKDMVFLAVAQARTIQCKCCVRSNVNDTVASRNQHPWHRFSWNTVLCVQSTFVREGSPPIQQGHLVFAGAASSCTFLRETGSGFPWRTHGFWGSTKKTTPSCR